MGESQEKEGRATHSSPFEAGVLFGVHPLCKGFSLGEILCPLLTLCFRITGCPAPAPFPPPFSLQVSPHPLHSWHSTEDTQHSRCSWGYNPAAACWLRTYDSLGVTQGAPEPGQLVRESASFPHTAAVPFAGKAWPLGSCCNSTFTPTPTLRL